MLAFRLFLLASVLVAADRGVAQSSQTLPVGFDNTPGNSPTAPPFSQSSRQRWHWVYDSAQFRERGPMVIKAIAVRPASDATFWPQVTYENFEVRIGISRNDHRQHHPTFDLNFAGEPLLFFQGNLTVPSGSHTGIGVAPWSLEVIGTTGYVYDPTLGRDLIIEVRTPAGSSQQNPFLHTADAHLLPSGSGLGGAMYGHTTDADAACYRFKSVHEFAPIVRIDYDKFPEVAADFGVATRRGVEPLTVGFDDLSVSGTGAAIATWDWDFDDDGNVDSNDQNPTFQYRRAGIYSVTLTVTDGQVGNASLTRRQLIEVATTTTNTLSPEILDLHFNEVRGTRVANSASTTLAPAFGDVRRSGWQADPGRTLFAGAEAGFGCLGIDDTAPYENIVDTGWRLDVKGPTTFSWWQRMQTAPGAAEAVIMQAGTGFRIFTGGSAGTGIRIESFFQFIYPSSLPVQINPGSWVHVALIVEDSLGRATWYVNGFPSTVHPFTPGSFALCAGDLLTVGGDGGVTSGTRYFELDDVRIYTHELDGGNIRSLVEAESTVNTLYDSGCAGPGGIVPRISANSPPTIGNNGYTIRLDNAEPGRPAALMLGFTTHVFGLFPFDLSAFLGAGCGLSVFPDLSASRTAVGGTASVLLAIPNQLPLIGEDVYAQWIVLGSQGAVTPALDMQIRS